MLAEGSDVSGAEHAWRPVFIDTDRGWLAHEFLVAIDEGIEPTHVGQASVSTAAQDRSPAASNDVVEIADPERARCCCDRVFGCSDAAGVLGEGLAYAEGDFDLDPAIRWLGRHARHIVTETIETNNDNATSMRDALSRMRMALA